MSAKEKQHKAADEEAGAESTKERQFDLCHNCLICGQPGPETICEHCKIVVQAEAVARKQKIEKEGRPA